MTQEKRRTSSEEMQAGDYFGGAKRYYDQMQEVTVVKIYSGDCYVSKSPGEMMVTILGSCVAACIRDPETNIGGMNHFLLPDTNDAVSSTSTRFGAFAMEELINGIIRLGGRKERLEIKLFGGANVIESSARIGEKNCNFVRHYLEKEGLRCRSEDLGGDQPRRIHYYPDSGRVMMRKLNRKEDFKQVANEEQNYQHLLVDKTKAGTLEGDVELF